jgi:16S rRNA (guanine527-N7)-methyltransferase
LNTLAESLTAAAIELTPEQVTKLDHYCRLLWEKNKVMNLTRHTNYSQFVNRDLVDTIQLSNLIKPNEEVLDIGSGGGVPGIVLAIIRPDIAVTLCDSVGKKAAVLKEFCKQLKLEVTVENARAEELLVDSRYDTVTARAVGPLAKIFKWLEPHWINFRQLLAIKGPKWKEERLEAEAQHLMRFLVLKVAARYPIPGEDWESVILEVRHTT